ncbi:hypothetical protein [Sporosarcina sp. FSL K6-3457]|uniref:hypothetical protein n=1 Tax=Sporosarcina sp. FSL K6-3457 TaxID=2978204 RepID=UPI0030F5FCF2
MKKIGLVVALVLLLTGCNREFAFSEVAIKDVNSKMKETIETLENGNYIFSGEKVQYVFLNRGNIVQGEEAIALSNIMADVKEQVLTINFSEMEISDFEDKDAQHQLLYKITGVGDFDTISLTRDGESLSFDSVLVGYN